MSEHVFWMDDAREDAYGNVPCEVREPIVRCRDCANSFAFDEGSDEYSAFPGKIDCMHFAQWDYYDDAPGHWPVEPDGFCAWGVRRQS